MIDFSPCKINIGLSIISKLDNGYHNIESVFYPIPLNDIIEVTKRNDNKFNYSQSGLIINGDIKDNLLFKAWKLIDTTYKIGGINIHIHKQIPMQAGLGGGSSNASTLLKMLNKILGLKISNSELKSFATQLGADCPFFIDNKETYAFNIGTDFKNISLNLSNYNIVLVKAPVAVSTKNAYSGIVPKKSNIDLQQISTLNITNWKNDIVNDFEQPIFKIHPVLNQIKNQLYSQDAIYSAMSGSGSTIYGIFDKTNIKLDFPEDYFIWQGRL